MTEFIKQDNIIIIDDVKDKKKKKLKNNLESGLINNVYEVKGYLNNFGFCIEKKKLSLKVTFFLRIYFKVTPKSNYEEEQKDIDEKSFEVFYEDDNYIILPKFVSNLQLNLKEPIVDLITTTNITNSYNQIIFIIEKYGYKKQSVDFNFSGNSNN